MEKFEQIQSELWRTFVELEAARGRIRRRCLRRARLLLLLADEMLAASEDETINQNDWAPNRSVTDAHVVLQILVDNARKSEKRGSCQGLQSVLVLRRDRSDGKSRYFDPSLPPGSAQT